MLVAEAINTDTRVLEMSDPLHEASAQMHALQVSRLPVVEEGSHRLRGQISRITLDRLAEENPSGILAEVELEVPVSLSGDQHLFGAVQLMLQHEVSLLPVVDEQGICQGIIQKEHVLELLGRMLNLAEYGSVITVELSRHDFTLSEIVQLIETEGGRILGITVEAPGSETGAYEVSIKLNLQDVSRIAASLRRYDYKILTEAKSESTGVDLETRADEFLKYLNI